VAGQIAQRFAKEGLLLVQNFSEVTGTPNKSKIQLQKLVSLWKHRPFTRVIKGWRAYKIVSDYIQLNEKEARGEIRYQKQRLRGLSSADWDILWS
jgi:hypothetical protein